MSEIDPWALPQGQATQNAGVPGAPYAARPIAPLNKAMPLVVIAAGALYVIVSLIEVLMLNNRVSVANQIQAAINSQSGNADDLLNKAQSADSSVNTVSVICLVVFVGTLIAIGAWQRSLNATLGSIGARRAVFNRAGYMYFRGAWIVSILLSLFLQFSSKVTDNSSVSDVISHDHMYMVYFGARALVGVVLIVFALRLKKFSEEGVRLLAGAGTGYGPAYA